MTASPRMHTRVPRAIVRAIAHPVARASALVFEATPAFAAALALVAALVATLVAVPPAHAAAPSDPGPGFRAGLRVTSSSLPQEQVPVSSVSADGGGLSLYLGWAFNDVFSLELDLLGAGHDTGIAGATASFAALDLLAVYHWRPGARARPYVKGGLGAAGMTLTTPAGEATVSGGAVPFGVGVDVAVAAHVTLGLDVTHRVISWDELRLSGGAQPFAHPASGSQTSVALALGLRF